MDALANIKSKEENEIELEVTSAFKKVEAQINRDLAKELKCKQYEIADIVYKKILAHRKTLMDQVIKDLNKVDLISVPPYYYKIINYILYILNLYL